MASYLNAQTNIKQKEIKNMEKKDILRIRKHLQEIKRILYPLTSDKTLSINQIKLLSSAYKTMEKVASSINDPYDI